MYFFVFHVKPLADLENLSNIAGAYVSCWIEENSLTKASEIAKKEIRLAKWEVLETDEAYEIKEDYYSKDSEEFKIYKQALIDKWFLRFHTYPSENDW
jgi:hypothetical protein